MWNVPSPPALILRHSGNYTAVTGFVTVLLVILLCSRLVFAICRFEVLYKLEIICSKKFPVHFICIIRPSEILIDIYSFKFMDHRP
jgi:hypothetical protein